MPKYQIDVPGHGKFEVDSPSDLSDSQAYSAIMDQIGSAPAPQGGILGAAKQGAESFVSSLRTGAGAMTGNANEAATSGIQRQEDIANRYAPNSGMDEVKKAYNEKGLLSAAGEFVSQVPKAIAGQSANLGAMAAGAAAGSVFGPFGAAIGAAIPSFVQFTGTNLERQAQEQIKSGQGVDVNTGKAILAAIPQTALDIVETRMLLGSKVLSGALGISEKSLAKMSTEAVEKAAAEKLLPILLKGTAKGVALEIPSEVSQQILERAQAGLSLTSPDAIQEYGDTMYQVSQLGLLGVVGKLSDRGQAREELAKREATKAAENASIAPEQAQTTSVDQAPATPAPMYNEQPELFQQEDLPFQLTPDFQEFDTRGYDSSPGVTQKIPTLNQTERAQSEVERNIFALEQKEQTPEVQQQIADLKQQLPAAPQDQVKALTQELLDTSNKHTALQEHIDYLTQQRDSVKSMDGKLEVTNQIKPLLAQQASLEENFNRIVKEGKALKKEGVEFITPEGLMPNKRKGPTQATQAAMELEVPTVINKEDAVKRFGVTKGAKTFLNQVDGLDMTKPEDRQVFEDAVALHERKGAKIDMQAIEDYLNTTQETQNGIQPAVGVEPGGNKPSIPVPSTRLEPAGAAQTPEPTSVAGNIGATGGPNRGAGVPVQAQSNTLAPPTVTDIPATAEPAKPNNFTKLNQAPTVGKKVKDASDVIQNLFNSRLWVDFRIKYVDPSSSLGKTLSSLSVYDKTLRADMLLRTNAQIRNVISNGLEMGLPSINDDGSIVIKEDAVNNLANSRIVASKMDNNPIVKAEGWSGMQTVAEIARVRRGQEILAQDTAIRLEAQQNLAIADRKMKESKAKDISHAESRKLFNEATALRKEYKERAEINREKQIKQLEIDRADRIQAAVPEVQQVLDIWRTVNESLIDLREQAGLVSKEQAAELRKNVSYVPLFAPEEDLEAARNPNISITSKGTKTVAKDYKLEGADIVRNIWENVYKQYAMTVAAVAQNQGRKVGVEQLSTLGAGSMYKESPDGAKTRYNANDPEVNIRYRDANSPYADDKGVVNAVVDNANDLVAFQMMQYQLGPLMRGLAMSTKLLRAGALINPMYWVKQLIRDPLHASVVGKNVITPVDSIREYINILNGNSPEAKILARHGAFGTIDSTVDLASFLNEVGAEKSTPSSFGKAMHKIMQMHEASDAATRVAVYKKAYKDAISKGMSKEDATTYSVFQAREVINFSVHGNSETLNFLRNSIPFFSAAITSLDTLYRAATGYNLNPAEKAKAKQIFYSRALMMTVMSMAYAMALQDDEDYKKLPDDVKDGNWLLPNPIGGGHSFIKIPVPFEVGLLFKTVPEAVVRYLAGNSTGKEVLASYKVGIIQNLPSNGVPVPQAFKPIIETVTNHSFFTGRPLESMADQGVSVAKRGQNASEVAKTLSSYGLDKINLSPTKIDNIIQGYTAQLGSFATSAVDSMLRAADGKTGPSKNIEEMAGFKTFMTNPNTSKAAGDFYELQREASEIVRDFNRLKNSGDSEGVQAFVADSRNRSLLGAEPYLRKIQTQLATLHNQAQLVKNNEKLPEDVRQQRVNELMTMYHKVALQAETVKKSAKID